MSQAAAIPANYRLTLNDLPRYARPDRRLELVDGNLFVSAMETPYLQRTIANADHFVRAAAPAGANIRVNEPVVFDEHNVLIPDVSLNGGGRVPLLVVEVRSDSTERYALGPKRLVYARARIPEYWFLDPRAGLLAVLRLAPGLPDYPWPPLQLRPGDMVNSANLALSVAVADLVQRSR